MNSFVACKCSFLFRTDVVRIAYYLINHMPFSVLNNQVPHSLVFPKEPIYKFPLCVFRCTCFVHDLSPERDKLSPKYIKYVFLGYSRQQNCYSPTLHKFFASNVTFFESYYFFSSTKSTLMIAVLLLPFYDPILVPSSSPQNKSYYLLAATLSNPGC